MYSGRTRPIIAIIIPPYACVVDGVFLFLRKTSHHRSTYAARKKLKLKKKPIHLQ